jgi:hypothetical protein
MFGLPIPSLATVKLVLIGLLLAALAFEHEDILYRKAEEARLQQVIDFDKQLYDKAKALAEAKDKAAAEVTRGVADELIRQRDKAVADGVRDANGLRRQFAAEAAARSLPEVPGSPSLSAAAAASAGGSGGPTDLIRGYTEACRLDSAALAGWQEWYAKQKAIADRSE